jgi:hypothetical protein
MANVFHFLLQWHVICFNIKEREEGRGMTMMIGQKNMSNRDGGNILFIKY